MSTVVLFREIDLLWPLITVLAGALIYIFKKVFYHGGHNPNREDPKKPDEDTKEKE